MRLKVVGSGVREVTISSNNMWGEGLEEVEELQRERDGRDSLLATTDSSVYQQYRTTFFAFKYARGSYYGQRGFGGCFFGSAWEGGLGPCSRRWQGQGYGQ